MSETPVLTRLQCYNGYFLCPSLVRVLLCRRYAFLYRRFIGRYCLLMTINWIIKKIYVICFMY